MTDRVNGLYVALDKDYRDDDVQVLIAAIKMLRGVADVETNIVDIDDYYNRAQIRDQLRSDLFAVISDIVTPKSKS
jgi:hypothetical protein